LCVSLKKDNSIVGENKKCSKFDESLKYIKKMLDFDDFTRASNLYKRLLNEKECDIVKIVEDEVVEFSKEKSNKVIRDYLTAIRGILLNHIINNIDKDKNEKFSEIRRLLKDKTILL
jgi:hypothetical protein